MAAVVAAIAVGFILWVGMAAVIVMIMMGSTNGKYRP